MSHEAASDRLVRIPDRGRVFDTSRRVRLSDVRPSGEMRFDAIARFIQDVSNDDSRNAGLTDDSGWVVRRTVVEIQRPARYLEQLSITTFCSGMGSRWAERRVSMNGDGGAMIEAATLWVHVDPATGRPMVLPPQFHELYGETVNGRRVSASLSHGTRPPDGVLITPWSIRQTDLDTNDHVNNAASWELVEEAFARWRGPSSSLRAELEYRAPMVRDQNVMVATCAALSGEDPTTASEIDVPEGLWIWAFDSSDAKQSNLLTGVIRSI